MWTPERAELRRMERRFGWGLYLIGRWMGMPRDDGAELAIKHGTNWTVVIPNLDEPYAPSLEIANDEILELILQALRGGKPKETSVEEVLREALADTRQVRDTLLLKVVDRNTNGPA